jgi:hypothetical protein
MAGKDDVNLTERQQYWLKHIRACNASGKTTIDYAREHGIKVKSMYSARKALAEKGTLPPAEPNRFHKVQVVGGSPVTDSQWHVQLPNGLTVSFGGNVDAPTLSLVLSTAATLS